MDAQIHQVLYALEESLWRGETRFDDALMVQTFAADFVEFGRSGRVYAREEMMLGHMAGTVIDAVLPLRDFNSRLLSADVALVTYVSEVRYQSGVEYANRSSVWSYGGGGWQLRFHQGTPCLAP